MSNIDFSQVVTKEARVSAALANARAGAVIPKSRFCIALATHGIITNDECVASAQGHWPDGFRGFLDFLSDEQARDARTLWAAAPDVWRMDGTIIALAWWFGISDETLDLMFGVSA